MERQFGYNSDAVLFWCHGGTHAFSRKLAGIVMDEHAMPLATNMSAEESEDGFAALLGSGDRMNLVEFFNGFGIEYTDDPGPWVYGVSWDDDEVGEDESDWEHLENGEVRRVTPEEWAELLSGDDGYFKRL